MSNRFRSCRSSACDNAEKATGGTAKIGMDEYDVHINSAPLTLEGISNIPVKQVGAATIYIKDVARCATALRSP